MHGNNTSKTCKICCWKEQKKVTKYFNSHTCRPRRDPSHKTLRPRITTRFTHTVEKLHSNYSIMQFSTLFEGLRPMKGNSLQCGLFWSLLQGKCFSVYHELKIQVLSSMAMISYSKVFDLYKENTRRQINSQTVCQINEGGWNERYSYDDYCWMSQSE